MEWNEKISMATEKNYLVAGKRVAAEMMVLCLSVMSLSGEPLQIQKMKYMNERPEEMIQRTETLDFSNVEIAGEICLGGTGVSEKEKPTGKEQVCEMAETAETVAGVSGRTDNDPAKKISADRLNYKEDGTEYKTAALPANAIGNVAEQEKEQDKKTMESDIETITPVTPAEVPETGGSHKIDSAAEVPDDKTLIEDMKSQDPADQLDETATEINSGFVIDDTGKIIGIKDRDLAVSDGCLMLPTEGCTGIVAGAFLGAGEGIIEIELPSNLTELEEGAFLGLNEAEWIETEEENPVYFSEDGVLFSEKGTCLFAFPAGRTGTYPLPERVTRIASDAFAGASIEKISNLRDREIEFGNMPDSIALERVTRSML